MKKSSLTLIVAFAALCLTGCQSFKGGTFSQDSIVGDVIGNDPMDTSSNNSDTQGVEESNIKDSDFTNQENNSEVSAEINTDLISELGMTYLQLTEKYGEPHGIYNSYEFGYGAGYGRYVWKSDDGKIFDDMESAGGCNFITGVKPEDLFLDLTYPADFDELSNQYGLVPVSVDSEIGEDGVCWAEFTYPSYDNVSFIFSTGTCGSIDEITKCTVTLNVDCLKAEPVI